MFVNKFNILTTKAIIKPTEIIKDKKNLDSKCKKIIRNMITNNEEIDLKYFVGEFFSVFNKLQIDIMDELKKEIILNLDLLEEYLIGDNIKKAESYIIDEQDNIILSPSNIFYSLFIKIEQEYKFDINVTDFLNDYYNL